MKLIRFRRLHRKTWKIGGVAFTRWEIALNEEQLFEKLNGEMAEIIMPEKPLLERLRRRLFPLRGIECQLDSSGAGGEDEDFENYEEIQF